MVGFYENINKRALWYSSDAFFGITIRKDKSYTIENNCATTGNFRKIPRANYQSSYKSRVGKKLSRRTDPSEITVGSILRILEGSLSPVDCLEHGPCKRADVCASLSLWQRMKTAVDEVVDTTTLADLVTEYYAKNTTENTIS